MRADLGASTNRACSCDITLCLDCADLTEETMPREDEPWFCEECDDTDEATYVGGRRRARRRSNEEEVDESRGRGRLGEADALRAARALGRNWRRGGRGPMDRVLDGFVVDDGEAFLRSPRVPFSPTQRPKYVSKQMWEDFDRAQGLGAMNQNL